MNSTKIEWATMTWNPITGCSPISEGCQNCYAARMAHRLAGRCGYDKDDPFGVRLHAERLYEPFNKKRKAQRVFVCSMGDLFHDRVPEKYIDEVIIKICRHVDQHKFMILTKRPDRMSEYFHGLSHANSETVNRVMSHKRYVEFHKYFLMLRQGLCISNLWLGVTAENQRTADERIPILLQIPAAGRFVSVEPMLGNVDLWPTTARYQERTGDVGIDWVICGAETGPRKRFCDPEWIQDLREQCEHSAVPFFGKKDSDGQSIYPRQIPDALKLEGES